MSKRVIIIVLVLAAAGAAVYAFRGSTRGPENHIVVSGNIELTEVNIAFKTAGRLIERNVDEGDRVTKGQVIARLDRDQLLAQRSRESAALAGAFSKETEKENCLVAKLYRVFQGGIFLNKLSP